MKCEKRNVGRHHVSDTNNADFSLGSVWHGKRDVNWHRHSSLSKICIMRERNRNPKDQIINRHQTREGYEKITCCVETLLLQYLLTGGRIVSVEEELHKGSGQMPLSHLSGPQQHTHFIIWCTERFHHETFHQNTDNTKSAPRVT